MWYQGVGKPNLLESGTGPNRQRCPPRGEERIEEVSLGGGEAAAQKLLFFPSGS